MQIACLQMTYMKRRKQKKLELEWGQVHVSVKEKCQRVTEFTLQQKNVITPFCRYSNICFLWIWLTMDRRPTMDGLRGSPICDWLWLGGILRHRKVECDLSVLQNACQSLLKSSSRFLLNRKYILEGSSRLSSVQKSHVKSPLPQKVCLNHLRNTSGLMKNWGRILEGSSIPSEAWGGHPRKSLDATKKHFWLSPEVFCWPPPIDSIIQGFQYLQNIQEWIPQRQQGPNVWLCVPSRGAKPHIGTYCYGVCINKEWMQWLFLSQDRKA